MKESDLQQDQALLGIFSQYIKNKISSMEIPKTSNTITSLSERFELWRFKSQLGDLHQMLTLCKEDTHAVKNLLINKFLPLILKFSVNQNNGFKSYATELYSFLMELLIALNSIQSSELTELLDNKIDKRSLDSLIELKKKNELRKTKQIEQQNQMNLLFENNYINDINAAFDSIINIKDALLDKRVSLQNKIQVYEEKKQEEEKLDKYDNDYFELIFKTKFKLERIILYISYITNLPIFKFRWGRDDLKEIFQLAKDQNRSLLVCLYLDLPKTHRIHVLNYIIKITPEPKFLCDFNLLVLQENQNENVLSTLLGSENILHAEKHYYLCMLAISTKDIFLSNLCASALGLGYGASIEKEESKIVELLERSADSGLIRNRILTAFQAAKDLPKNSSQEERLKAFWKAADFHYYRAKYNNNNNNNTSSENSKSSSLNTELLQENVLTVIAK